MTGLINVPIRILYTVIPATSERTSAALGTRAVVRRADELRHAVKRVCLGSAIVLHFGRGCGSGGRPCPCVLIGGCWRLAASTGRCCFGPPGLTAKWVDNWPVGATVRDVRRLHITVDEPALGNSGYT